MQPNVRMRIITCFFNQFGILGFIRVFHELCLVLNAEVYEQPDTSIWATLVLKTGWHYQTHQFKVKTRELYPHKEDTVAFNTKSYSDEMNWFGKPLPESFQCSCNICSADAAVMAGARLWRVWINASEPRNRGFTSCGHSTFLGRSFAVQNSIILLLVDTGLCKERHERARKILHAG